MKLGWLVVSTNIKVIFDMTALSLVAFCYEHTILDIDINVNLNHNITC